MNEVVLFTAVMQKDQSQVEKIAKYYDFIEIQPPALYQDLIDRELIRDTETLHEIYQRFLKYMQVTQRVYLLLRQQMHTICLNMMVSHVNFNSITTW